MKYLDAYRDPRVPRTLLDQMGRSLGRRRVILEVCGGQAHNLLRFGIDRELPEGLELIHGPSCPTCATPAETLERAVSIAGRPDVIVAASGDILHAPRDGGGGTLRDAREGGADVRSVYSPLDALALARKNPDREVVVVAVGFETTAPAAAAALTEADRLGLDNLSVLGSFFRLAPAVEALLTGMEHRTLAVLVSGTVCAVTGVHEYEALAVRFRLPIVVTGPGPVDLLDAIVRGLRQLDRGTFGVENQYDRAVRPDGTPQARAAIAAAFETVDAHWRGLGRVAGSGLVVRERFRRFDATARYPQVAASPAALSVCPADAVQSGRMKPQECPAFGTCCTPEHPLGPFMISAEGVCAAYHRYRRSSHDETAVASALAVVTAANPPDA